MLEFSRHMIAHSVVYFIRSLATECRVGQPRIVLLDIEGDKTPKRGDAVERVKIEPLVLEHTPPSLDKATRLRA